MVSPCECKYSAARFVARLRDTWRTRSSRR